MASLFTMRRLAQQTSRSAVRSFQSSSRAFIKVGDKIPNLDVLVENSPGNKVNLSSELAGKGLIIGVPAAFSKKYTLFRNENGVALEPISLQTQAI